MLALFRDDARVPVCPNASELVEKRGNHRANDHRAPPHVSRFTATKAKDIPSGHNRPGDSSLPGADFDIGVCRGRHAD
jgi:hypothetical protein